jgi:hypothetical protein
VKILKKIINPLNPRILGPLFVLLKRTPVIWERAAGMELRRSPAPFLRCGITGAERDD